MPPSLRLFSGGTEATSAKQGVLARAHAKGAFALATKNALSSIEDISA